MFLEINDMSTGSLVVEPLNMLSVDSVYIKQADSKYQLLYKLNNGLIRIEEFDTQAEANNRLDEVKEMSIGGGGGSSANVYTYKGSCLFANKPSSGQVVGDVWNIEDNFTLDGKNYPAGTNIAWDGTGWDPLAGSMVAGGLTFAGAIPASAITGSSVIDVTKLSVGIYWVRNFTSYCAVSNPSSNQTIKFSDYAIKLSSYLLYVVTEYDSATNNAIFAYAEGDALINGDLMTQMVEFTKNTSATAKMSVSQTQATAAAVAGVMQLANAQTVSGKKTFSTLPEVSSSSPTYSNIKQFVAKGYVDISRNFCLTKEYDPAKTYKIGDYMFKSDSGNNPYLYIYKCKLNTPDPAGNYNSAYWDKIAYYEVDTLNLMPPKPIVLELEGDLDTSTATPIEDATLIAALNQVKDDFDLGAIRPIYLRRTFVTGYNGFMCYNGMVSSAQEDTMHNTYTVAFTEMYPDGVQWGYVIFQYLPIDEEDWGWHVIEHLH